MATIANFPDQRTSRNEKTKKEFYIPTINYIVSKCSNNGLDANKLYDTINGIISQDDYSKFLNPLNSKNPKYTSFPAYLRNYDIISDVIRRYMGEFIKQNVDFTVYSSDPDVIDRFNITIQQEILQLAMSTFEQIVNNAKQGVQNNQDVQLPDFQSVYEDSRKKYIDKEAIQGQHALNAILDYTDSAYKYYKAFFDFITVGRAYSYRDIRGTKLYKEIISAADLYTQVDNTTPFISDRDYVYRKFRISIPKIISDFSTILKDEQVKALKEAYKNYGNSGTNSINIPLTVFKSISNTGYDTDINISNSPRYNENGLDKFIKMPNDGIDGIHIQFKTEVRIAYIKTIDPLTGAVTERMEEVDSYTPDPLKGEFDVEYDWINETWEVYRFLGEHDGIYTEPRPIAFQCRSLDNIKDCKLSYGGIEELIPGTGFTFSIPTILKPFQISRNILYFAREKAIGRNKGSIMVIPKSTLGSDEEETLYRMDAASLYIYDDSDDDSNTKANSIKPVDIGLDDYIIRLTDIIDRMKNEAWDLVDMNPQRYGDINTSAGKATTNEAIVRSSMGSVLIYTIFDKFLEKEYTMDIDYSKVLMANMESLSYRNTNGKNFVIPFDSKSHILADYKIFVRNSAVEREKRRKAEDIAFAAAQNNQYGLAITSITEESTTALLNAIKEFDDENRAMQERIANEKEQLNLQLQQLQAEESEKDRQNDYNIAVLKEKGENNRTIIEVQAKLAQLELTNNDISENTDVVSQLKLSLDRLKQESDMIKHRDKLNLERDKIRSNERIAKMNKN
ncbi:MAG: hypothetical protein WC346_03880 [Methanogenium sp.]|jgi:hypothetical protein